MSNIKIYFTNFKHKPIASISKHNLTFDDLTIIKERAYKKLKEEKLHVFDMEDYIFDLSELENHINNALIEVDSSISKMCKKQLIPNRKIVVHVEENAFDNLIILDVNLINNNTIKVKSKLDTNKIISIWLDNNCNNCLCVSKLDYWMCKLRHLFKYLRKGE